MGDSDKDKRSNPDNPWSRRDPAHEGRWGKPPLDPRAGFHSPFPPPYPPYPRNPPGTWEPHARGSVDEAYSVLDDHIRDGYHEAQHHHRRHPHEHRHWHRHNHATRSGALDPIGIWFEMVQRMYQGLGDFLSYRGAPPRGEYAPFHYTDMDDPYGSDPGDWDPYSFDPYGYDSPSPDATKEEPYSKRSPSEEAKEEKTSIEVASKRPVRVKLDIKSDVRRRRSFKLAKPRLASDDAKALEKAHIEMRDEILVVRLEVPDEAPAGHYHGCVSDTDTGESLGTVTVTVDMMG
ncbi:MAG: hypothetical protein HUU21_11275 [Polyangiaceae bacterium]|nr:hypothetical protein [Polyangiaceae bacterium]